MHLKNYTTRRSILHSAALYKIQETIINLLITTFMKKILNYLFVLCLLVGAYGCSDDDRDVKRIYPEENKNLLKERI